MKIIRQAKIYAPEFLGKKDVLVAGGKIQKIQDNIVLEGNVDIDEIEAQDMIMFPGFIDSHVHITGGGGEGSFSSRTPEIMLSDITSAGVTTVIGTLGTDGTTRTMTNLLAKARGLEEEGITTFVNTGSYQIPVKTITGSITDDIILIEKIIGVGEIAISDHRSSQPSFEDIAKLIADARLGGMLSGKAGTVNFHLGDSKRMLDILFEVAEKTEIPLKHIVPTHTNRNPYLFEDAIKYAKMGGYIDFTTSTVPQFIEEGEVECWKALKRVFEEGIDMQNITFSSDAQGSLPRFDQNGTMIGIDVGKVSSLYEAVISCIKNGEISIEKAIMTITSNPARIYKLKGKGFIKEGMDADIVLVDEDTLKIKSVLANGRLMVSNEEILIKGTFEK